MNPLRQVHSRPSPAQIEPARIDIANLRLRTYIGFNPEEKTKLQDVVINATIFYRAERAFASDEAADALDYKVITKRMIEHVENGRFQLLEKLASDLLAIAIESQQVSRAEIRVDKPHALRFADSVAVTLAASRVAEPA